MPVSPTKKQEFIIECRSKALVVVGTPGTGKTTVALWKALWFLQNEETREHQQVLFVSFSNAAVYRIREAARVAIPRDLTRRLHVTTFHALCHEILSSHIRLLGIEGPFQLLPPEDVSVLRNTLEEDELERELRRLEVAEGRVDFDRFAPLVLEVLRSHEPVRRAYGMSYPLVLVDEYQDTSDVEDELVRLFATDSQLVCLGDPEQRIYEFRAGSRPDRLDRLRQSGDFDVVELEATNHRSGATDIVAFADAVLRGDASVPKPKNVFFWGYGKKADLRVKLKKAIVALEQAVRKAAKSPRRPVPMAIMGIRNALVGEVSGWLREPEKGFDFSFEQQVLVSHEELALAWDVVLTLLGCMGPGDVESCVSGALEASAKLIMQRSSKNAVKRGGKLRDWARRVREGTVTGQMTAVRNLIRRMQGWDRVVSGDPDRDGRTAREILRSLPGDHFRRAVALLDLRMPVGTREALTEQLRNLFDEQGNYGGARDLGADLLLRERLTEASGRAARRTLMTLHKSKGKEFDVVIIIDGLGPADKLTLRDDPAPYPRSRRLLRVALTRAKVAALVITPAWDRCPLLPVLVDPGK